MYVNVGPVIAAMGIQKSNLTMEETLHDKGILEKIDKKKEKFSFLYSRQQS